jgi:predicted GNAT family N-acyltransferase
VYLSARESAVGFYEKMGFNVIGAKFPSPKTGIIHVSMVLSI